MSQKILISIGFLSAAWVIPVQGQESDPDLHRLNFNIGGGVSVPLNPIGRYLGVNANFITGVGANFNKYNSFEGDYMWSGLSPNLSLLHPINAPTGDVNLNALTGNYRFHVDSIAHSAFGFYVIGGGGWYYRITSVNKNYVVPGNTVCQPIYNFWGYSCTTTTGYVDSVTIASHGTAAGGFNAGAGFTVAGGGEGWKVFGEARYHYAWNQFIPTSLVSISFGFRFN